jgi:hypothetical protein
MDDEGEREKEELMKGKGVWKRERGGKEGAFLSVPFAPPFYLSFSLTLPIQLSLFGSPFLFTASLSPFTFPLTFAPKVEAQSVMNGKIRRAEQASATHSSTTAAVPKGAATIAQA